MRVAYEEVLAVLRAAQVAAAAPGPGDPMPGFLLPNAEGALVSSAELLARGPLVLSFFRGAWCPYCAATSDALEAAMPALSDAGASLVGLTPETGGRALAMKRARGLGYELLVDVDLAVAMLFGLVFRTPPLYAALLRERGTLLPERQGNPGWLLPVPATVLVGADGIVRRTWIDVDFTRRADPAEILRALHAMRDPG